jgi:hypothetical protein
MSASELEMSAVSEQRQAMYKAKYDAKEAQPKKPRMTPKRLREALLDEYKKGYEQGKVYAYADALNEYEGDKFLGAMANFAAGALVGVIAFAPALRWVWHFILAHSS